MLPTTSAKKRARSGAMMKIVFFLLLALPMCAVLGQVHLYAAIGAGILSILFCGVIYHISFSRLRKRQKIISTPFPTEWEKILNERVDYYIHLQAEEQERFRRNVQIFIAEKKIEGAGIAIDDTLRVLVAASAVIPIFGFPEWEYGMLDLVVVRPEPFEAHFCRAVDDPQYASGMVGDAGIFSGSLVLSQPDLLRDFQLAHDKHNVGIHEFSHLIDKAGGHIDGVPVSLPRECYGPWLALVQRILAEGPAKQNRDIPLYGFTNDSEFFAVISEYFFEKPQELHIQHPELFSLLQRIFRQTPQ